MMLIEFIDGTRLVGDFQASGYGGNSSSYSVDNHISLMRVMNEGIKFIRLVGLERDKYNVNNYNEWYCVDKILRFIDVKEEDIKRLKRDIKLDDVFMR